MSNFTISFSCWIKEHYIFLPQWSKTEKEAFYICCCFLKLWSSNKKTYFILYGFKAINYILQLNALHFDIMKAKCKKKYQIYYIKNFIVYSMNNAIRMMKVWYFIRLSFAVLSFSCNWKYSLPGKRSKTNSNKTYSMLKDLKSAI